jgi:anaerobic magnesium-protoporphyrin IX monomethyl ester cyclase
MKFALTNPPWTFEGSIYFGCRESHLPLEFGYAKLLLEAAGHEAIILDGLLDRLSAADIREQLARFQPDFTVVTTAPTYLFWRCAPPELTVPKQLIREIRSVAGAIVAVGPHCSTTPRAALAKLDADVVVMGECEEILPQLTGDWEHLSSICYKRQRWPQVQGAPHASDMKKLGALHWPDSVIRNHAHHHHRFDAPAVRPGAEMETSRGCPYHCTFCAKDNFRNQFRKRPLAVILEELDALLAQGIEYVYFIDEIFLPDKELLGALADRHRAAGLKIGVQTRVDLWPPEMLDRLADAGCHSIEAGIESLTVEGRDLLAKSCKATTEQLSQRLIYAKRRIPFVQGNLIATPHDDPEQVAQWREQMRAAGVWANDPVPLFPYPGSPDYTQRWGAPDDWAWERAHEYYLATSSDFSDIQDQRPLALAELEKR